MHEATTIPTLTSDTSENLTAAARQAESWFGEPFLAPDEDPLQALAPGTARRAALDDALAEIESGLKSAVVALEGALRAHARTRARAHRGPRAHRGRDRASPPSDRRAHGHARRAHRGDATTGGRERERTRLHERHGRGRRRRSGRGGRRRLRRRVRRRRRGARGRVHGSRPRRGSSLPLPPPHGLREDDRSRRLRRGRTDSAMRSVRCGSPGRGRPARTAAR